jgi:hypothetical protein
MLQESHQYQSLLAASRVIDVNVLGVLHAHAAIGVNGCTYQPTR